MRAILSIFAVVATSVVSATIARDVAEPDGYGKDWPAALPFRIDLSDPAVNKRYTNLLFGSGSNIGDRSKQRRLRRRGPVEGWTEPFCEVSSLDLDKMRRWQEEDVVTQSESSSTERVGHDGQIFLRLRNETDDLTIAQCGLLGSGWLGTVYVGRNLDTHELVAVKVPKFPLNQNDEVRNVKKVNQFVGEVTNHGKHTFAMKLARGVTLTKLLRKNYAQWYKNDYARLRYLLRLVVTKVHAGLLNQGFSHRDLHFSNIMVADVERDGVATGAAGTLEAIDFGQGRIFDLGADAKLHALASIISMVDMVSIAHEAGKIPKPKFLERWTESRWSVIVELYELLQKECPTLHLDPINAGDKLFWFGFNKHMLLVLP